MPKVLVLQHHLAETLGIYAQGLTQFSVEVQIVHGYDGEAIPQRMRGFDGLVNELVHATSPALIAVPRALLYRFLKRVTAHCANVVTAVIMPVDRLDYFDEDFDTRG